MTSAEVFSYALALKGAGLAERILQLLDTAKREEVEAALEPLRGMPPEGIRQLWCERRRGDELSVAAGG